MTTYRYRDHRGSLQDSLATTVEVDNLEELRQHLGQGLLDPLCKMDSIVFKPMPLGMRAMQRDSERWETHTVILDGCAIGYSDGIIPELEVVKADEFDYRRYQVEENGKAIDVAHLSSEQLRRHLCAAMETIERLDEMTGGTSRIIKQYRDNKIKPKMPIDRIIDLTEDVVAQFDSAFPMARGYLEQARYKLLAAIDNLKAAKKKPL
jgi:hypothetical protein